MNVWSLSVLTLAALFLVILTMRPRRTHAQRFQSSFSPPSGHEARKHFIPATAPSRGLLETQLDCFRERLDQIII